MLSCFKECLDTGIEPMKMSNVFGIFIIWISAFVLSIVILVIEHTINNLFRKKHIDRKK